VGIRLAEDENPLTVARQFVIRTRFTRSFPRTKSRIYHTPGRGKKQAGSRENGRTNAVVAFVAAHTAAPRKKWLPAYTHKFQLKTVPFN